MFGFDSGLPIAPTGEFPGFVNPRDREPVESVIRVVDDEPVVSDELAARRGRRPERPQ